MPDLTLSSSISGTKVFPKFLLPIEEFTLHLGRKLEGASQLHFKHSEIMLKEFAFCSPVKYSFLIVYQATLPVLKEKPVVPHIFLLEHAAKLSFTCCCILKVCLLLSQVRWKRFFWRFWCNIFQYGEWKHSHNLSRTEKLETEEKLLCCKTFIISR